MSSVDDRIVNMQFNNKQFESGVATSKRSLTGLESAIGKTAKGTGLTNMANSAQQVAGKFSVMKIAGISAIATVASRATTAGIGLLKSLTIDPILQGWDEYNTNLKSIQTVMANTGKGIKPVQGALQQLNKFSDQTIYNFSEMAKNVGTFTAAGVGLKESVSSIKGIANIAALSGSSSQQASTAMYQLSQAIAAGRVNLQDWNSVVNAGMGGKKLQGALVQTGIAMGKLDEKSVHLGKTIKISGESFRNSISAKPGQTAWLTSGVLTKTLALMDGRLSIASLKANLFAKNLKLSADKQLSATEINKKAADQLKINQKAMEKQGFTPKQIASLTKMGDAAYNSATVIKTLPQLMGVVQESIGSVWSNAFSGIVGNFNESKALWTKAGTSIQKVTNGFNAGMTNMISNWKKGIDGINGRTAVIKGFQAMFSAIGKVLGTVGKAFRDVFPPGGESTLAKISIGFMRLMQALVPSESSLKSIQNIFGGIFAVLHIGVSIVTAIAAGFGALFGALFAGSGKAGGGILQMLGSVGELLKAFDKWLTSGGQLKDFMVNLGTVVGTALHPIIAIVAGVAAALGSLTAGGPVAAFESIKSSLGGISGVGDKVKGVFDSIGASLSNLDFSKVQNFFKNLDFSKAGDMARQGVAIATGIISGLVSGLVSQGLPGVISAMSAVAHAVVDTIKGFLQIHSPSLTMAEIGKNVVLGLAQGIVGAISVLPAAMSQIASALGDLLMQGLRALPGIIAGAGPAMAAAFKNLFGGMDSLDFGSMLNAAITGGLLLTMKGLLDNFKGIGSGITAVLKQTKDSLKTFQSAVKAKMLLDIAIAIGLLAGSLLLLSFIPLDRLAKGLGALGLMLGMLVYAMTALNKVGQTVDKDGNVINKLNFNLIALGASMLLIATAMAILAGAVAIFGSMDLKTLLKGLIGMAFGLGILMAAMFAFTKFPKEGMAAAAGSLLVMAIAMNVLAAATLAFGLMDLGTLAKGLGAMAIGLILMVGALFLLTKFGPTVAVSAGAILTMAAAMVVLSVAVAAFGNMDLGTLAKGFIAVALGLGIMVAALVILGANIEGTIVAAGAMLSMALAMAMLVPVIATLGGMDMSTLAKGLGALAIALTLFVVAVSVLGAVAMVVGPGLLMLGGALALAGVGMLAFGTGFALMAAAGVAGVAVLTAAFAAIIALLPSLAAQVAAALVSMVETFAKAAPRLHAAMTIIVQHMLGVIRDNIPALGKLISTMLATGISVLTKFIPRYVEMGFTIIDKFLQSAAKHAPGIIKSVTTLIVTFLNGIANNLGRIIQAGVNLILKFITGVTNAINNNASKLQAAGLKLAMALLNGLTGGLLSKGWSMVSGAVGQLTDQIKSKFKDAMKIFSPSKVSRYWGEMIGAGLAVGLVSSTKSAVDAAVKMANAVIIAGSNTAAKYEANVRKAQSGADRAQGTADAIKFSASKVVGKTKAAAARRKKILANADKAQKTADALQKKADAAQAALDRATTFAQSDLGGKGDMRTQDANASAAASARALAKAAAENLEAKRISKTNRAASIALLNQAKANSLLARNYAKAAAQQHKDALAYYAAEVNQRIKTLEDQQALDQKTIDDQAELDKADAAGKAAILVKRAEANEALAAKLKADAAKLVADAKKLAATNATAAMAKLDAAEKAAADAKAAADEAKQQRDEAAQASGTTTDSSGGTGGATPPQDVLEQAASVVDRWTASLEAATQAAEATPQPIQYVQNNYSPVALSASEIYRQGKNLVSAAELKMGSKTG